MVSVFELINWPDGFTKTSISSLDLMRFYLNLEIAPDFVDIFFLKERCYSQAIRLNFGLQITYWNMEVSRLSFNWEYSQTALQWLISSVMDGEFKHTRSYKWIIMNVVVFV